MKYLLIAMIAVLALGMLRPAHAIDPLPFKDRAQELRFQKLTGELRCLVCQDEDLADSNAELAVQLRHKIFRMMQAGKSNAQIKQYLVERYSDYVLYNPPLKPSTWLLWFGPAGLLILGGIGMAVFVRRRAAAAVSMPPPPPDGPEDW